MKVKFLALFLLISGIQAISTSDFMNFTSEDKGLIQSNGQLLGKLQGSIEDSTKYKVEDTTEEALDTTRKTQGGGSSGSSGRTGSGGSSDVTRRPRQSSAPSKPHFWASKFILSVNLAFLTLFSFHYV
ncbi:hypothetical protein PHAVU_008G253100 [Phaseolus vulgaris]|uniref:Uncharacterized protein n=1 Tax=Phaseolus vulgaris TaxID=3885 RepID=V7BCA8_PHAVU|nr:hypothetical protein PHAVU_008G253100g [Phaseolus vulgaris]ESW14101.1 hypothetical protein PHAVU_008G253100g [Phaseolus vulgaris]